MPSIVNPQIIDSVEKTQTLVITPSKGITIDIVRAQVTQSLGLAISDATEYLRNMSAISSAATGVAFTKLLGNPSDPNAIVALEQANTAVENAAKNLSAVGDAVGKVLAIWPSE
ncbi:hypothetical protein ACNOYE_30920 [Nannocystaceae bacterium ST9]